MSEAAYRAVAQRIGRDLSRWERPGAARAELKPLVALGELEAWLNDAGRCSEGAPADWRSLLADVCEAWSLLGHRTEASMPQLVGVLQRLEAARDGLRGPSRGLDANTMGTLLAAVRELGDETKRDAILSSAIADVLIAAEHEQELDPLPADEDLRWQLVLLAGFAQAKGHDWSLVADRLRSALGIDHGAQELPVAEVLTVLDGPAEHGHSVVWIVVDHAWVGGTSALEPVVQLYEDGWLLGNLKRTPRDELIERGVPDELAADPERALQAFEPRLNAELPVVLARVDLGPGRVEGARERALDTLELVRAHASFHQGGTNWRISGARLHFVDGRQVLGSYGPIGDPDVYGRLLRGDVLADPTPSTLNAHADYLAPHLPVFDGRTREALELTRWLTVARQTWNPARLILSERIIEQCATWSERNTWQLVDDLALPWAWQRLEARISRVGRAAVMRMPGHDGGTATEAQRSSFLQLSRAILERGSGRTPPAANPRQVVEHLPLLLGAHASDSEVTPALVALDSILSTGQRTHLELERLTREIGLLRRRAKRTRNALVHGGPLKSEVVDSVLVSADQLASLALRWVLEGQLTDAALPSCVAELAKDFRARMEALGRGGQPRQELFWQDARPVF